MGTILKLTESINKLIEALEARNRLLEKATTALEQALIEVKSKRSKRTKTKEVIYPSSHEMVTERVDNNTVRLVKKERSNDNIH